MLSFLHPIFNYLDRFSLHQYLSDPQPFSGVWHLAAIGFGSAWLICYLVHFPESESDGFDHNTGEKIKLYEYGLGNMTVRRGLIPVTFGSLVWFWMNWDMTHTHLSLIGIGTFSGVVIAAAIRWGISDHPPQYHKLPRDPPLKFIRDSTLYKPLHLVINEYRLGGVQDPSKSADYTKPQSQESRNSHRSSLYLYLRGGAYGLSQFMLFFTLYDVVTYPVYYFDPKNLGYPNINRLYKYPHIEPQIYFDKGIQTISDRFGIPVLITQLGFIFWIGVITATAMNMTWHMYTFPLKLIGLYLPEEFPTFTKRPFFATSMIDFWGKRYHQTLRNVLQMTTLPFPFIPLFLRIFIASALYHCWIFFPMTRHFAFKSNMITFMGCGFGCLCERLYYKYTGKKVEGFGGWLWTVIATSIIGYPYVQELAELGWFGQYRFDIQGEASIVENILFKLGLGSDPKIGLWTL